VKNNKPIKHNNIIRTRKQVNFLCGHEANAAVIRRHVPTSTSRKTLGQVTVGEPGAGAERGAAARAASVAFDLVLGRASKHLVRFWPLQVWLKFKSFPS